MDEHRILRSRILDQADLSGSGYSPPSEGTPRMVVQVYDAGSMPTSNDHYFACHPVELDGDPTEGGTGSLVVDTDSTIMVDVLGSKVPAVGALLQAFHVGGRWCAESSGGCSFRVCLTCSDNPDSPEVVGAFVRVVDPDTHLTVSTATTDATGCCSLVVPEAGDYELRISSSLRPTTNSTQSIACGSLINIELCGNSCELCTLPASDLTLTLSTDNGDPVVLPMSFGGLDVSGATRGSTWTAFGQGTQSFTLACTDPTGWTLTCSYFDTTISAGTTCRLNLGGDCEGPSFFVLDLGGCTNITSSTHFTLPITITL